MTPQTLIPTPVPQRMTHVDPEQLEPAPPHQVPALALEDLHEHDAE
jgi:hypothetical protein